MKSGFRSPSPKKSFSARTTGRGKRMLNRILNPAYGKRGMGALRDPDRALYNLIYKRTTIGVSDLVKTPSRRKKRKSTNSKRKTSGKESTNSIGGSIFLLVIIAVIIAVFPHSGVELSHDHNEKKADISYTEINVDAIAVDVHKNKEKAAEKYVDNYYAVTGKVDDFSFTSGSYIYLLCMGKHKFKTSFQGALQNDEQKEILRSLKENQVVTIYGKVTDIPWDDRCEMVVDYLEAAK